MSMNVRTVVFTRNFTDHYSYHIHYKTLVKLKRIIDNVYIFHDKQHKKGLPCHVWSLLYFYVNMYFGTYRKLQMYFRLIWKNDRSQYKISCRISVLILLWLRLIYDSCLYIEYICFLVTFANIGLAMSTLKWQEIKRNNMTDKMAR